MDREHNLLTVWDASTLAAVATIRSTNPDRVVNVGLSGNAKTIVIFRYNPTPSAELWDVDSGQIFATLRPPSSAVAAIFGDNGKDLNRARLQTSVGQRDTRFWDVVQSLTPAADERKGAPVKQ